jgi:hypothetical protein
VIPVSTRSAASSGGGLLQAGTDRRHDGPDRLPERLLDLIACDDDAPGEAVDEVPSLDVHLLACSARRGGRAQVDLNLLRLPLPDQQAVDPPHVLNDGLVHLVAGDSHGLTVDDPGQGHDRHLGRAPANVHDHVGAWGFDREASPEGGGHRLLDQVHLAGARFPR